MEVIIKAYQAIISSDPVQKDLKRATPFMVRAVRLLFQTVGRLVPKQAANWALSIFGQPRTRYYRKSSKLFEQAERINVNSKGIKINCYVWENDGPSVLLVHGWETAAPHMRSFVKVLLDSGFRVIAMDGPAHGKSQGQATNLVEYAAAIHNVIEQLGPVAHLIGHSFGGISAVYMAASGGISMDKLVLISVPNSMIRIIADFCHYLKIPRSVQLQMHKIIEEKFHINPRDISISKMGSDMIVKKILVVHDHTDQVVPFYNALEIVHALTNACLLPCYNAGHNRILKEPQVLQTVSEFLRES